MKLFRVFIPLLFLMFACEKKGESERTDDFNTLMGSNKSVWKFVETYEDYQNLSFFKALYRQNSALQFQKERDVKIPKVIHIIWVGPNAFPKESVLNVNSWIEKHPGWVVKFWTDRKRSLPHQNMELNLVADFNFESLKYCYEESDNYAERSYLLRYEILNQEGGVCVNHDTECYKSLAPFHHNYHLYCGLEPPHEPVVSSSICVNSNIIGACPRHAVLQQTIDNVKKQWDDISEAFPGSDRESAIYRLAYRSQSAFDEAARELAGKGKTQDIVFPAAYFNRIDEDFSLFAQNHHSSTWLEDETGFEKNIRKRLISVSRKNNQILLFNAVILIANLVLFAGLLSQFRIIRKKNNAD